MENQDKNYDLSTVIPHYYMHQYCTHLFWTVKIIFWVLGVLFLLSEHKYNPYKQFPLKMKWTYLKYWGKMKKEKAEILYRQKPKIFLKGFFCVPYTWGQFVCTSEWTLAIMLLALQIIWNLGPGVAMMSLYGSSCVSSIACCFLRTKKL